MSIKNLMNQEIDLKKLDELAKTNANAKQRQKDEMINILRKTSLMFPFVNEQKIQFIAERLIELGYGCASLKPTVDKILNEYESFPSFKVILDLIRHYKPKPEPTIKKENSKAEMENLKAIRAKFVAMLGEEKLEAFTKWWISEVYGADFANFFKENWKLYQRVALIDWKKANYSTNFNEVILISKKEIEENKKPV